MCRGYSLKVRGELPDDIVERLSMLHQIGIDTPMVHFYPMLGGLETFASEVMPRLPIAG